MMILKEFSRIVCVSLFSYQGSLFCSLATAHLVYHSHFCLSRTFLSFFKTFLMTFSWFVAHQQLVYFITFISECQVLFSLFYFLFFNRNRPDSAYWKKNKKEKSASLWSGLKYIIDWGFRQVIFLIILHFFNLPFYHFPKNFKKTFTSTSYL